MTIDKKLDALLDHCGPEDDRLIAQSRENIKALIAYMLAVDNLPPLTAIEGALTDVHSQAIKTIEASLPMTWEEIKNWMEDYSDED